MSATHGQRLPRSSLSLALVVPLPRSTPSVHASVHPPAWAFVTLSIPTLINGFVFSCSPALALAVALTHTLSHALLFASVSSADDASWPCLRVLNVGAVTANVTQNLRPAGTRKGTASVRKCIRPAQALAAMPLPPPQLLLPHRSIRIVVHRHNSPALRHRRQRIIRRNSSSNCPGRPHRWPCIVHPDTARCVICSAAN